MIFLVLLLGLWFLEAFLLLLFVLLWIDIGFFQRYSLLHFYLLQRAFDERILIMAADWFAIREKISAFNAFEAFESLWNFSRAESMSWCSLSVNFEYAFTCCKAVSQKMIIKIRSWCFFILSWCLDKILWWDYYSFWDFQ